MRRVKKRKEGEKKHEGRPKSTGAPSEKKKMSRFRPGTVAL